MWSGGGAWLGALPPLSWQAQADSNNSKAPRTRERPHHQEGPRRKRRNTHQRSINTHPDAFTIHLRQRWHACLKASSPPQNTSWSALNTFLDREAIFWTNVWISNKDPLWYVDGLSMMFWDVSHIDSWMCSYCFYEGGDVFMTRKMYWPVLSI